jgi:hypothetical protein
MDGSREASSDTFSPFATGRGFKLTDLAQLDTHSGFALTFFKDKLILHKSVGSCVQHK